MNEENKNPVIPETSVEEDLNNTFTKPLNVVNPTEYKSPAENLPVVPDTVEFKEPFVIDDKSVLPQVHVETVENVTNVGPSTEQITEATQGKNIPNIGINPVTGVPIKQEEHKEEANILFAVVYFLPEITQFINEYGKIEPTPTPTATPSPSPTLVPDEDVEYQKMSCDLESNFGSIVTTTNKIYYYYDSKVKMYEDTKTYSKTNADAETLSRINELVLECTTIKTNYNQNGLEISCEDNTQEFIYKRTIDLSKATGNKFKSLDSATEYELPLELNKNIDDAKTLDQSIGSICTNN